MLALEIQKHNVDPTHILQDKLNMRLLTSLSEFAKTLKIYGLHVNVYSEKSLEKLNEISTEKKEQHIAYFDNWCSWIQPEGQPLPIDEFEKACLKKALKHFGLKVSDDFWNTIEKDQIIEIYGTDFVQLYRSLNFFNITGYSLLDMTVFEWYVLWHRPSQVIQATLDDCRTVFENYVPVKKFTVPGQIIRESYNTGLMVEPFIHRAVHAQFTNMGSLVSAQDDQHGEVKGLICTTTAQVIAYGDEATKIQFI